LRHSSARPVSGDLDEVALLADLVRTPSVSGDEAAVAQLVEQVAQRLGLPVQRDDAMVAIELDSGRPGRHLALVSHLDTVPVGPGWTRAPFSADIDSGRLWGRGANDAKASVAAMIGAALDVQRAGGPQGGKLWVVLGYCEETRDTSMPRAVPRLGPLDAAVVGEPTSLDLAVAQRGLLMCDLIAHGDACHAAYAAERGAQSAVLQLAADLLQLPHLLTERPHPLLGQPTITPTWLEAGIARNVMPPVAKAVLDLRTTPSWDHAELQAHLQRQLRSEVVVTSSRLQPCETPPGSPLLAAALELSPNARRYGSPTCSDWVFLRHLDAIKCGPGDSRVSHTADEWVSLDEVRAARRFYAALASHYLANHNLATPEPVSV